MSFFVLHFFGFPTIVLQMSYFLGYECPAKPSNMSGIVLLFPAENLVVTMVLFPWKWPPSNFLRRISTFVSQIIFRDYPDIVSVKMTPSNFVSGISTFVSQIIFREYRDIVSVKMTPIKLFKRNIDVCVANHISWVSGHGIIKKVMVLWTYWKLVLFFLPKS